MDEIWQRVCIGAFELRQTAPVEHTAGQFHTLGCKGLQRVAVGGPCTGFGFASAFQAHLVEKDFAKLLG